MLGGTSFLGPALVEGAIAEGHTVTLFNRGVTNPDLFPHQEKLRGFRSSTPGDEDLSALARRRFDAVVDVWPNDPALAASAAEFLKNRVGHYLYVSSIAAYDSKEFGRAGIEETAPLESWIGPGRKYNRGKAESERRLHAILGDKLTIVRPAGAMPGLLEVSSEKAFRAGWQTRPFQETALDCLTYFRSLHETLHWDDYLSADKEKQVLDAWAHRSS